MTDRISKGLAALVDLFISFLPVLVLYILLAAFDHHQQPGSDMSFLVATLFTDGAWKARLLTTDHPAEKSSVILIGVIGAIIVMLAAILQVLVEQQVLKPQYNLGVQSFALWISFYGYLVAVLYAWFVRYKTPD
jgi:hypothetical protein